MVSSFRPKQQKKYYKDFCLEIFCSLFWATWELLGAPLSMISLTKSPGSPWKPQKVQGRNPNNIFVAILVQMMTQKRHFEISWLLGSHHKSLQANSIEIDTSINPKSDDFLLLSYQFCTSNCFCKNLTDLQKDRSNDNDLLSYVFWSN